jgi:NTE family protein
LRSAKLLAPSMWTWGRSGYEEFGRTTLTKVLGQGRDFSELRLPLAVIATDLVSGSRRVIDSGDVISATLASAAIPGITNPVERDGVTLIDGGFADPAPVDVARAMGADVILAVYTGQHLEAAEAENWLVALLRGMEIAQRSFAEARLRGADLVLRPNFGGRINVIDFSAVQAVVRSGAEATRVRLDDLRALVGAPPNPRGEWSA